jgi:hypothetical protein
LLVPVAWTIAVGALIYDYWTIAVWDGQFLLRVNLTPPNDRKIIKIFARPVSEWVWSEVREAWAANPAIDPKRIGLELDRVAWIEGQPFTIPVHCSGRVSNLGRELSYSQGRHLALRVEFEDGGSENLMVDIPDSRFARSVTVSVP